MASMVTCLGMYEIGHLKMSTLIAVFLNYSHKMKGPQLGNTHIKLKFLLWLEAYIPTKTILGCKKFDS